MLPDREACTIAIRREVVLSVFCSRDRRGRFEGLQVQSTPTLLSLQLKVGNDLI